MPLACRICADIFSLKVHHKILARPKPIRTIGTADKCRLVVVVGYGCCFGHVCAFFGAGVVGCGHLKIPRALLKPHG